MRITELLSGAEENYGVRIIRVIDFVVSFFTIMGRQTFIHPTADYEMWLAYMKDRAPGVGAISIIAVSYYIGIPAHHTISILH